MNLFAFWIFEHFSPIPNPYLKLIIIKKIMQNMKEMSEKLNNSKRTIDKEIKMALKTIELNLQPNPCCPPSLSIILVILF